jgi:hypothetical protein
MLSRSVGVVATCCALGANAFLLPSGIAPGPAHRTSINPFVSVDPKNQVLELPCSSCAFSAEKTEESVAEADDAFSIQGGANNLILNFTVSEDGQELNLNDVPIYPVQAGFDALGAEKAHSWIVNQLPASSSIEELEIGETKGVPLRISGAGTKMSKTKIISANGDEIIPLEFQILSLNDQPMTIDEIAIQLLRDEDGELLILSVEPAHQNMMDHLPMSFGPPPPPHPHFHPGGPEGPDGPEGHRPDGHHPKECGSLPAPLCRFLHTVDEKFAESSLAAVVPRAVRLTRCQATSGLTLVLRMPTATASWRAVCLLTCAHTVLPVPATGVLTATTALTVLITDTLSRTPSSRALSPSSSLSWLVSLSV